MRLDIIRVPDMREIDFHPYHQIVKLNQGNEPYEKSVTTGPYNFTFCKVAGIIYIMKPSKKGNRDRTKQLCAVVTNPVTLRSAEGSITGNCARGVKQEYLDYAANLVAANLSDDEVFKRITLNIDGLK